MSRCPYCGAKVILRNATYIYKSKKAENWGKVWVCSNFPKCDAYVGCHQGTDIPKGRLANEKLRILKREAHKAFDPIWMSGLMNRREAYKWLADMLNIDLDNCHIGMFDNEMCIKTIRLCRKQHNSVIDEYKQNNKNYRNTNK